MAKNDRRLLLKLHKIAENYRQKGQHANAIREYENILKQYPAEKKLYNTLGDLYQLVRDKKNAIRSYIAYAKALEDNGFTLQAIAVYKKITRIDNEDPEVYAKLADLYNQQGIIAESISMYMHLANLYQKQGLVKRAIAVYEKVIDLQPDNLKIIALLADQYLKEGMKAEAIDKYLLFADILLKKDEWDKVKSIYNKILELDPDNVKVRKGIGNLYFHGGDFENAEKYLVQAIRDFPDNEEILKDLGEVYIKIKDFQKGRKIFERLTTLIPDDTSLRKKYAFILLNLREDEEAKKHLDILVSHYKSNNAYDKMIDMLNDAKRLRKHFFYAYNTLIDNYHFLKQESNKYETMKELGIRYYERDKIPEAYEIFREIKSIYSKDSEFMGIYNATEKRIKSAKQVEDTGAEEISAGEFDIENIEGEINFDIPDDLVAESDASSPDMEISEGIDEVSIPVDEIVDESREDIMDLEMEDVIKDGKPGNTEEVIIVDDDFITSEDDFFVEDSGEKVEISEDELEREIDQLELSQSQEVPLLGTKEEEVIDKSGAIIEDLEVDLVDDMQSSEYDKDMDRAFSTAEEAFEHQGEKAVFESQEDESYTLIKENLTEAEVFLKFGLTEKAYKHIKAALDINPENIDTLLKLKELYSLEGKKQDLIAVSMKIAELYRVSQDEEHAIKEYKFLQSVDPNNPVLKDVFEREAPAYAEGEKHYDSLLDDLVQESDVDDDFEIIEEQEGPEDTGVSDLIYTLKNNNILEQESIDQDLVDAQDLFSDIDEQAEPGGEPAEGQEQGFFEEEEEGEKIEEFSDEDLSGEDMEIDSSLSDDFFELVSPDDSEESYDIGEEMGLVGPEDVTDSDQSITQIVEEFKKGVNDQLSPEDYETHYNLGIAFKEMGLIEDAIEAFEKAASTGKIMIESVSMLGLCYIEKGMYQRAIDQFKRGLEFLEKDSDPYIGMIYDLANVYEISNDPERAYIYFEEIKQKKPGFRDTKERLSSLEGRINKTKVKDIKNSLSAEISRQEDPNNPRISYI